MRNGSYQRAIPPRTPVAVPAAAAAISRGVSPQGPGNAPTWRKNRRPDFTSCAAASPCSSVGTNTPPIPDPHHQLMHRVPTRLID
ncbi:unnamed protein product [Linum tenue]|uniref:Uncharacterized protein n=1 Tax=Linum tenue TaxID=586396 RepID=A0AAV0Q694_9ROSI|nr:unnamed protein product [Linum tenue]